MYFALLKKIIYSQNSVNQHSCLTTGFDLFVNATKFNELKSSVKELGLHTGLH
jgi:hypothetical protein